MGFQDKRELRKFAMFVYIGGGGISSCFLVLMHPQRGDLC